MSRSSPGRGAVLLEVLLSIALFVGAATLTLGTTRSVLVALDRTGRESVALDLARSKMAELDAGLVTIAELRESAEGIDRVGSVTLRDLADDSGPRWELTLATERTGFAGLTLVAITVSEMSDDAGLDDAERASVTLRQLVALREEPDEEYEEDDLLRGLPTEPEPGTP